MSVIGDDGVVLSFIFAFMLFAKRLKQLREERGFSQSQLAKLCGIDKAMIGRWETTSSTPSPKNMMALAAAFGMTPEELAHPAWKGYSDEELNRLKERIKSLSPANQRLVADLILALSLK